MCSLVGGVLVAGAVTTHAPNSEPQPFEPAGPGEPTFIATVDSIDAVTDPFALEAEALFIVHFSTKWSGDTFPGDAICRVVALDGDGKTIGVSQFQYAAYSPSDESAIEIDTRGLKPASANIACSAARLPPRGAGYKLSDLSIGKTKSPVGEPHWQLTGKVAWATGNPPLYQECLANVRLADESAETYTFGISVGNEETFEVGLDDKFAGATVEYVTCASIDKDAD